MKLAFLLPLPLLFTGCTQEDLFIGGGPITEEITKGQRYNLQIGDPAPTIYAQLQALGEERGFDRVAVVRRGPYADPSSIPSDLGLYDALTVESTSGTLDRIFLEFSGQVIGRIERGGGLLDSIPQWPPQLPATQALVAGDSLTEARRKLDLLYQSSFTMGYEFILPDKPLARPYDPDMGNYDEWSFTFFEDRDSGSTDRHDIRLRFATGNLDAIRITRERFELVY